MKKTLRFISIFLVCALVFALTACGASSYPSKENVVFEGSGVKIIYTGVDLKGNVLGPQIKFRIENNSGYDLTVQTRKTSVNGYTLGDLDVIMSTDVKNGEKANGTMLFLNSTLKDNNITALKNVVTSFHMFYMGQYASHYLDTKIVTVLNVE